mmetsp:Transcript_10403/g.26677  ORF Transcript_10403/g.26677 Transcript_10403/m.26677 type:complete len:547 (-) Transcript_10403:153-1793(-)
MHPASWEEKKMHPTSSSRGLGGASFGSFRSTLAQRRRPSDDAPSRMRAPFGGADADLISIGKIEDNLQTMHRSVFEHLRPLDCTPSALLVAGSASPGLVENMNVLSVRETKGGIDAEGEGESKPPISFACLIGMAILASEDRRLTVSEVYAWIRENFPYFNSKSAGTGWKNSVRHNLSLNKHFVKLNRDPSDHLHGKGSYWTIRPESVPAMEAAICKQEAGARCTSPQQFVSERVTKVSLPRRAVQRPSAQAAARARRDSIEMDDATAATMLCSLGGAFGTSVGSVAASGDTEMRHSSPTFGGPSPPSHPRAEFPNLGGWRRPGGRAHSAAGGSVMFSSASPPRKHRTASAAGHIKAAYSANPSKAPPRSGQRGTNMRSFSYVPSAVPSRRRDLSSAGIAPAPPLSENVFQRRPPASGSMGYSVDDVELEDVPRPLRSPAMDAAAGAASASHGDGGRFFTFSAPMSFSKTPETRRYTPETGAYMDRPSAQFVLDEGTQSQQGGGVVPPKTRRKLAIPPGDSNRSESDASAAAALLGLSGSSMMLCN